MQNEGYFHNHISMAYINYKVHFPEGVV